MRRILDYWRRWRSWEQSKWDDFPFLMVGIAFIVGVAAIVLVALIAYAAGVRL